MTARVEQQQSPPKNIYMFEDTTNTTKFQKDRPEDTGQEPDYIYTCEKPAPRKGGKIQAAARQDLSAPYHSSWPEERSWSGEGEGAQAY